MANWDPVIPILENSVDISATLTAFGKVVDSIRSKKFAPPPPKVLNKGDKHKSACQVCVNCDARFSCSSFREYAVSTKFTLP